MLQRKCPNSTAEIVMPPGGVNGEEGEEVVEVVEAEETLELEAAGRN